MGEQRRGLGRRAEAHGLHDGVVAAALRARSGGGTRRERQQRGLGVKGRGAIVRAQGVKLFARDADHRRTLIHKRQARAFPHLVAGRVPAGSDARFQHVPVSLTHQIRPPLHDARRLFFKRNVHVKGGGRFIVTSRRIHILDDGRARPEKGDGVIYCIAGEDVDEEPTDDQWGFFASCAGRRRRRIGLWRSAVIERIRAVGKGGKREEGEGQEERTTYLYKRA